MPFWAHSRCGSLIPGTGYFRYHCWTALISLIFIVVYAMCDQIHMDVGDFEKNLITFNFAILRISEA